MHSERFPGYVMGAARTAVTGNGLPQEFLMMNNNNYLPAKAPFIGAAGAGVSQRSHVNSGSLSVQNSLMSDLNGQYMNNIPWSGISTSVVINNTSSDSQSFLTTKPCEHQGSYLGDRTSLFPAINEYSDGLLPPLSVKNSVGYSNAQTFTFTSPTQSSLHSPAIVSYTPPRLLGSRTFSHTFAPTGFTQWQHSVPHRLPWSTVSMTTQSGVSVFTGTSALGTSLQSFSPSQSSSPWTTSYTAIKDPVASCSEEPRRPKRPSGESLECLGPSNKMHITEEKFAKHMEGLSIKCMATAEGRGAPNGAPVVPVQPQLPVAETFPSITQPVGLNGGQPTFSSQWTNFMGKQKSQDQQWKTFQELEESLDVSDEEAEIERRGQLRQAPPTVHFVQDLGSLVPEQDIIPKHILKEIQRPNMEVMLWTPPGDSVKKVVPRSEKDTNGATMDSTEPVFTPVTPSFGESRMEEDTCMDTEMDDDL